MSEVRLICACFQVFPTVMIAGHCFRSSEQLDSSDLKPKLRNALVSITQAELDDMVCQLRSLHDIVTAQGKSGDILSVNKDVKCAYSEVHLTCWVPMADASIIWSLHVRSSHHALLVFFCMLCWQPLASAVGAHAKGAHAVETQNFGLGLC
jgi:hypothetical protein